MCVDDAPAHLDRPFTYEVPEALADVVRPGVRVAVPFAGRDSGGWVLAVGSPAETGRDATEDRHEPDRPLRSLRRVVSPVPGLDPDVLIAARAVADRYAGTLADVLRTAVPPRHARAERDYLSAMAEASADGGPTVVPTEAGAWDTVTGGVALVRRVTAGEGPAAAVRLPVATDQFAALSTLAAATVAGGRSAVLVVPDAADLDRLAKALAAVVPRDRMALLHHEHGPARRWRAHLSALLDRVDVVAGTRAAVFAPAPRLGLVAVWDDGDDRHAEPRSPGWHVREVALLRGRAAGAAVALVSHGRSVSAQHLVRTGALKDLTPDRTTRRALAPRVVVPDPADPVESAARLPRSAHRAIADGLRSGPVLVSVPRRGGVPVLRCGNCRARARCRHCERGHLAVPAGSATAICPWCGRDAAGWECGVCGHTRLRAGVVGSARTAHEMGVAFPEVPVVTSDGDHRVRDVPASPALVVATPGAEPTAVGGYRAAVALDGDLSMSRPGLSTGEQAVSRWLHLASLTMPAPAGGLLVLVADPGAPEVQAVVADAPERYAERVLDERDEAGMPPAVSLAAVTGDEESVRRTAAWLRGDGTLDLDLNLTVGVEGVRDLEILGPAPVPGEGNHVRLLVLGRHADVAAAARELAVRRPAGADGRLTVRLDPADL